MAPAPDMQTTEAQRNALAVAAPVIDGSEACPAVSRSGAGMGNPRQGSLAGVSVFGSSVVD